MKRFLIDILVFLVMSLGIASVGDFMVSRGLRKTTIRKFAVWNDIYNHHNLDNDLVILGASSCWRHYNPRILDSILHISTYNLGIDGHPWYPCQPLRYNTYVRFTKPPKYVIVNIDMGTLGTKEDPYEREQFFPYFWLDDSLVSEIRECKDISFMDRYCPMWRYIGYRNVIEAGMASFMGKTCFEDDGVYKGHLGNTIKWDRASLKTMDSITIECNTAVVDSLFRFIVQRKLENREVIMVKTPIYYELQQRFTNREEMSHLYDSIARLADVKLLDYWDYPIVNDSAYFYNPSHLNKRGADAISVQLANDLLKMGVGAID